jgi:hypothetical protein
MTQFPILNRTLLEDDDQRAFWDEITLGPRGFYVGGPDSKRLPDLYNAWMQFPALGRAILKMAEGVREAGQLPGDMREMVVLVTSARLGALVEFDFHVPFAQAEGIPDEVITAIRARQTPSIASERQRVAYEANVQFLETGALKEDTREAMLGLLGFRGMMHFISTVTIYVVTAYTTNVARVKLADDFEVDPEKLKAYFTGQKAEAE